MTGELTYLGWTLVLGLTQLLVAAVAKRLHEPSGWAVGARDEAPPTYAGVAGRLDRAHHNLMETLPLFVGAVLICHMAGREGALSHWGAALYFWGRLAFVPVYAAGLPYLRTIIWLVALVGLCLLFVSCLAPA